MARSFAIALILVLCLTETLTLPSGGGFGGGGGFRSGGGSFGGGGGGFRTGGGSSIGGMRPGAGIGGMRPGSGIGGMRPGSGIGGMRPGAGIGNGVRPGIGRPLPITPKPAPGIGRPLPITPRPTPIRPGPIVPRPNPIRPGPIVPKPTPIRPSPIAPKPVPKPIVSPVKPIQPSPKPIVNPIKPKPIVTPPVKPVVTPPVKPVVTPPVKPVVTPPVKPVPVKPVQPIQNPKPVQPSPTPRPVQPTINPSTKPNPGAHTPTNVYQANPAWKDMKLGNGQTTIQKGGCVVSSLAAMAERSGLKINGAAPNTLSMNNWLKDNGGFAKGSSEVNTAVMSKLGYTVGDKISGNNMQSTIQQGMNQGKSILLNVGGHQVLATGKDATGYTVIDPGHQYKNHYTFDQVQSARVYSR